MAPYQLSSTAVFATTPEIAWDTLVAAPLEELFTQRSGPIGPVARTESENGGWGRSGQTRTVVLADGSRNLETLVAADRATREYRYRLTDFHGPFRLLVRLIEGSFEFTPDGDRTRVTWTWLMHPTNPVAGLGLRVVGMFWRRWARDMWPRFGDRLPT